MWRILNKLKIDVLYELAIPLLSLCPKNSLFDLTDTCSSVFIVALYSIARKKNQSHCPSTNELIAKIQQTHANIQTHTHTEE